LIGEHAGFFLEDKGWALAIHARFSTGPSKCGRALSSPKLGNDPAIGARR
jgi:hypothetical protein